MGTVLGLGVPTALVANRAAQYGAGFHRLSWARMEYVNPVDGTRPLYALAVWPRDRGPLELLVVMHGYRESAADYFSEAKHWAERGRFVLLPDLRGRRSDLVYPLDQVTKSDPWRFHLPGWGHWVRYFVNILAEDHFVSAGSPDSSGAELLDIPAAMAAARERFGEWLVPGADILGYSGGGTNALLIAARMPYVFDRVVAFFPIVDFVQQEAHLRQRGAGPLSEMHAWIGGRPDEVPHRYAARSVAAVVNNLRHSRTWILADRDDPVCPTRFLKEAMRAAPQTQNLRVLISGPKDKTRWHHSTPDERSLLHRVEPLAFTETRRETPSLRARVEEWTVAGYLRLPDLEIDLGDRQAGVVRLLLTRTETAVTLDFQPVTIPDTLRARVRVWTGREWIQRDAIAPRGRVEVHFASVPRPAPEGSHRPGWR